MAKFSEIDGAIANLSLMYIKECIDEGQDIEKLFPISRGMVLDFSEPAMKKYFIQDKPQMKYNVME